MTERDEASTPTRVGLSEGLGAVAGVEWTPHAGGACPLAVGTRYDTLHRDGSVTTCRVVHERDRWDHHGTACDIVAYRLTPAWRVYNRSAYRSS